MLAASSSFSSPVAPTSRGKTTMALALFVGGLCTSRGRVTSLALFYPTLSISLCFDLIPTVITLNGNRYRTIVFFVLSLSLFPGFFLLQSIISTFLTNSPPLLV